MNSELRRISYNIYNPNETIIINFYDPIKEKIRNTNNIINIIISNLYNTNESNSVIREGFIRGYISYSKKPKSFSKCVIDSILEKIEEEHIIYEKTNIKQYSELMEKCIDDTYEFINKKYSGQYNGMFDMDEIIENSKQIACYLLLTSDESLEDTLIESVNLSIIKDIHEKQGIRIEDPAVVRRNKIHKKLKTRQNNKQE